MNISIDTQITRIKTLIFYYVSWYAELLSQIVEVYVIIEVFYPRVSRTKVILLGMVLGVQKSVLPVWNLIIRYSDLCLLSIPISQYLHSILRLIVRIKFDI